MPCQPSHATPSRCTHLPLSETELALASSLSNNALIFLEGSADDARCDGNVAVVAGLTVNYGSKSDGWYVN